MYLGFLAFSARLYGNAVTKVLLLWGLQSSLFETSMFPVTDRLFQIENTECFLFSKLAVTMSAFYSRAWNIYRQNIWLLPGHFPRPSVNHPATVEYSTKPSDLSHFYGSNHLYFRVLVPYMLDTINHSTE